MVRVLAWCHRHRRPKPELLMLWMKRMSEEPQPFEDDLESECREAFMRLSSERLGIRLDTPGNRKKAREAYDRKTLAIDCYLDQYNVWLEMQAEFAKSDTSED